MVTITATKPNGDNVTKQVPGFRADDFVGLFTASGYTNITRSDETPAVEDVLTGRTSRGGKTVHKLVDGTSTACGASFRRNRLNNTVHVTGEPVTCNNKSCN